MMKRQKPLLAQEASPNYRVVPPGERIYVDTSVWVALLAREAPAAALSLWLAQAPPLCCANWAELELASALGIKHRRGELSLGAARSICDVFASMMVYQVQQVPVHAADVTLARGLCMDMGRGLRAGDALHLAVAMRLQCSHFFSLDHNLNRNAEAAGLHLVSL
jgi:predicted nucleic acid-binding protein